MLDGAEPQISKLNARRRRVPHVPCGCARIGLLRHEVDCQRDVRRPGLPPRTHVGPTWQVVLMSKSRTTLAALLAASVLLLAACAAGPNNVAQVNAPHIAGFWLGLWQGAISPVTFLVSVFNHNVNIYDVHNNG